MAGSIAETDIGRANGPGQLRSMAGRVGRAWTALTPGRRVVAIATLWLLATLPVLSRLFIGGEAGDLKVYVAGVHALLYGPLVYRDFVFEYPPFALLWFLLPHALSDDLAGFRLAFGLEMWAVDASIKAALLWYGARARTGLRDLAPFLAYSLGSAALGHVLLQRFDLVPAALTLGAALAVAGGWAFLGGLLVAIGAGTKLYPALLIPALALIAWRRGRAGFGRFAAGVTVATVPLLAAAFWVPWWRFASYHAARGLQVESLPASIVWVLHFAGVPAGWEPKWKAMEVTGPLAQQLVAPGRLLWVVATLACTAVATFAAWRLSQLPWRATSTAAMGAVLLLPVAAFVSTNNVLSPQFHLWLLPLAALVVIARPGLTEAAGDQAMVPPEVLRAAWCILAATLIVPVFYPHRDYSTGLGPWRTGVLLLRNGMLLYATAMLWVGIRKLARAAD